MFSGVGRTPRKLAS